ncbi:hypothetical protein OAH12_03010 [Cyclobacteriaceae bacterium]|nr:hypothetical protein [Cyclobacteriaceae bacterium]
MRHILIFLLAVCPLIGIAQGEEHGKKNKKQHSSDEYQNEMTIGVTTNTNSALIGGFSWKYLRHVKNNWHNAFGIDLVNVKNHKEEKFSSISTGNSFIPGKINYLYSMRLMYGKEKILFGKYPEDGVRLSGLFMAGPTLGFAKPYFIEYDYSMNGVPDYRVVPYNPDEHNISLIQGKGGFFNGFGDMKVHLGLNAKAAFNLEFNHSELLETVTGLEFGFTIEYFPKEVRIFDIENNPNLYTAMFLTLYFGSRY